MLADDDKLPSLPDTSAELPHDATAMEERGGTAPDGQALPDWLTYLSYETTIADTPYTIQTIANLPLTYYGPSIPLGDGWTYGGVSSPTDVIPLEPPTGSPSPTSLASDQRTQSGMGQATATAPTEASLNTDEPNSPSAPALTQESSTPAQSRSGFVTPPLPTGSSSSTQQAVPDPPSSTRARTDSPSPTVPPSEPEATSDGHDSSRRHLLAPLLETLLPLVTIVLLLLLGLHLSRKKRRSPQTTGRRTFIIARPGQSTKTPAPARAPSTPVTPRSPHVATPEARSPTETSALLPGLTSQRCRPSSGLDSLADQEPDDTHQRSGPAPRLNGYHHLSASLDTHTAEADEKAALLVPHHGRLDPQLTTSEITADGTKETHASDRPLYEPEADDELRELAQASHSLLHRLTSGMGFGTPSISSRGSTSSRGSRKASGSTLERGGGGRRIFSSDASAIAAGLLNWGKRQVSGSASRSGSGNSARGEPGTTGSSLSSRGGYERLADDQLFFRPPDRATASPPGSGPSSLSPVSPLFPHNVFLPSGASSPGWRHSGSGNRISWGPPPAPPAVVFRAGSSPAVLSDAAADRGSPEGTEGSATFSIGIPETPSTLLRGVNGEQGSLWLSGGDRNFPAPPAEVHGLGLYRPCTSSERRMTDRRDGMTPSIHSISDLSGMSDYHSANSRSSFGSDDSFVATGTPITRGSEAYRHVSVSAFGSLPATPERSLNRQDRSEQHKMSGQGLAPRETPIRATGQGAMGLRMSRLFGPSSPEPVTPGAEPGSRPGVTSDDQRNSYVGQPLIDASLRPSTRDATRLGDFGETLQPGVTVRLGPSLESGWSPRRSLAASLHLTDSSGSYYSQDTGASASGDSNTSSVREASQASHQRVLRGQRSQGRLVRASTLGSTRGRTGSVREGEKGREGVRVGGRSKVKRDEANERA
ncbi:hypothetical protein IAU60_001178 [Kwoniella sp. DSM 27419]